MMTSYFYSNSDVIMSIFLEKTQQNVKKLNFRQKCLLVHAQQRPNFEAWVRTMWKIIYFLLFIKNPASFLSLCYLKL